MAKHAQHSHAWGLEVTDTAVRLVRLTRQTTQACLAVDAFHQAQRREDRADGLTQALSALPLDSIDGPLAVCIADDAVLYRRLDLPPADPAVLEQMVRAQMEVLLPLPVEQLAWGWAPTGEGDSAGGVLLCAARREAVNPLANLPQAPAPTLTVPSALAVAAALRHWNVLAQQRFVQLDVAAHATTLLVIGSAGPQYGGTIALGSESLTADGPDADEARGAWQRELSAAYRQMMQEMVESPAPAHCVLLGGDGPVRQAAAEALAMPVTPVDDVFPPGGLTLPGQVTINEAMPAVGAALHVLSPPTPMIVLGDGRAAVDAPVRPRVSRRAGIAAAVVVAAVAGLYGLDVRHAAELEASATSARDRATLTRDTAQALALGEYLQKQPPPPLLVLKALSAAASDRAQVREWQFDRQGRLRISGSVRGVGELDKTLTRLTAAPPFDDVELRSASVERDTWTFEIETTLIPLHRYIALAAQSPRPAVSSQEEDLAHDDE